MLCTLGLALGLAAASNDIAEASGIDGPTVSLPSQTCYASGSYIVSSVLSSNAGYFAETSPQMPNQSGVSYIYASARNTSGSNGHGCFQNTVGFDFFLPAGASLAIDAQHPVYCFRGFTAQDATTLSYCNQSPQTGNFGGYIFGFATLAPGQFYDVQVPVRFSQAGTQHVSIGVKSDNGIGVTGVLNPVIDVPVPSTTVQFTSPSVTGNPEGTLTDISLLLNQNGIAGQLAIEYGTTATFGLTSTSISLPAQSSTSQSIIIATSSGAHYYWRARFTTLDGRTMYSTIQEFTTTAVLTVPPPCNRRGC